MKIITSNDIGGKWRSGKKENNDNSRRTLNTKTKKTKSKKK